MGPLSGYLLANTSRTDFTPEQFESEVPRRASGPTLRVVGQAFGLRRWDRYELTSPIPLADEPEDDGRTHHRYAVLILRGHSKLVLLAERRRIADYAARNVLEPAVAPRLRRVAITLDDAVRCCRSAESTFLITSLIGRFSGAAKQLKTIALYGEDVTNSSVFIQHGSLFNATTCGFGRRLFNGLPSLSGADEGEILRLGNDGFVTASIADQARALEFSRVIRFVVEHGWLESWVPTAERTESEEQIG